MKKWHLLGIVVGVGVLLTVIVLGALLLRSGSTAMMLEAEVQAELMELHAWQAGQPGLEDVVIERRDVDGVATIRIEGEVATEADYDRLMDRVSLMDAGIGFNRVTVAQPDRPAPHAITIGSTRAHAIGTIYIAGQPQPGDFEAMRDLGVTVVMNNRQEGESEIDGRVIADGLGMTYVHLPFRGADQLSDDLIDEAVRVFGESEGGVFAHCASGNRTSALWMAHRVINEGVPVDEAAEQARGVGLRSDAYEQVIRDYLERR